MTPRQSVQLKLDNVGGDYPNGVAVYGGPSNAKLGFVQANGSELLAHILRLHPSVECVAQVDGEDSNNYNFDIAIEVSRRSSPQCLADADCLPPTPPQPHCHTSCVMCTPGVGQGQRQLDTGRGAGKGESGTMGDMAERQVRAPPLLAWGFSEAMSAAQR